MARKVEPIKICVQGGTCWPVITWRDLGAFSEFVENSNAPEEHTGHYTNLFLDASIMSSIRAATQYISDSGTRAALESGIASAVKAMEKRGAADKIKITLGE